MDSVFKAIADPTRRRILKYLSSRGEMSAGDLARRFDITAPSMSHHFGVLKQAGLVTARRDGQQIYYALNTTVVQDLVAVLFDLVGKSAAKRKEISMRTQSLVVAGLILTAAALAYSLVLYPSLPQEIPTHWNASGQVNGWTAKGWGAFLMPGMMAALLGLLLLLPAISPSSFRVEPFRGTYNQVALFVVLLLGYMHVIMLESARRPGLDLSRAMVAGIFLFFACIGNLLGRVRRNFWLGVRTPWTLASDEVWNATHRFAARLYTAGGIAGAIAIWLGAPLVIMFIALMAVALTPVLYSLVIYKRLEGKPGQ